jgi:hypothetical protein
MSVGYTSGNARFFWFALILSGFEFHRCKVRGKASSYDIDASFKAGAAVRQRIESISNRAMESLGEDDGENG